MPEIAHGSSSTSRNPRDTAIRRTQVPPGFETPQVGTHVTGGLTLNTPVAVGLSHGLLHFVLYDIIKETIFLIKIIISNRN